MKISKKSVGAQVKFVGFNDKVYAANIVRYHDGIATIEYKVPNPNGGTNDVVGYISRQNHNRLLPA